MASARTIYSMDYLITSIAVLAVLMLIFFIEYLNSRKNEKKIWDKICRQYGNCPDRKYEAGDIERIRKLYLRYMDSDSIDDITANDIEFDDLFRRFNYSQSAAGSEYLYYRMRNPITDEKKRIEISNKADKFMENNEERVKLQLTCRKIGSIKRLSLFECIDYFEDIKVKFPIVDIIAIIVLIVSIAITFVNPEAGVLIMIAALCYNIISYYKERGKIDSYVAAFSYIVRFIKESNKLSEKDFPDLSEEIKAIKTYANKLKHFTRFSGLVINHTNDTIGVGNPIEMLVDYLKMIFHLDIIFFYRMLSLLKADVDDIESLYLCFGECELYSNIACIRASLPKYCIPQHSNTLCGTNMYHPLIADPVKNSIKADKGVLITGSNASGKSTFLKTVAVNVCMAQTICTCTADEFSLDDYSLFSSMSLRDDLGGGDSYFMVEIKALKRIFDYMSQNPDKKVLCFVDEVLRGTNTIERISAACRILKEFYDKGALCMAATHDGELTTLLEGIYDNYHFDETISENDVLFNYLLKTGRATSRNAIKLLSIIGFDEKVVNAAVKQAENFETTGEWQLIDE